MSQFKSRTPEIESKREISQSEAKTMASSAAEQLGWSERRNVEVQQAINNALARTAKCRQVIPRGRQKLGERGVVVRTIVPGPPFAFAADTITTPVNIWVGLQIDDLHMEDDSEVIDIIKTAAANLGSIEDVEIVAGAAGVPFGGNRVPRIPAPTPRTRLNLVPAAGGTAIAAAAPMVAPDAGGEPTALELVTAIARGMNVLEAGRPGEYGLLLHHRLVRTLASQWNPGGPPFFQQLPPLLGSDKIAGTNALDDTLAVGAVAGILFRLEPPAVDLVHTMPLTLSFGQRTPGQTLLRIEEDIAVRILDPLAVRHILY
jgi:hypothetical protein